MKPKELIKELKVKAPKNDITVKDVYKFSLHEDKFTSQVIQIKVERTYNPFDSKAYYIVEYHVPQKIYYLKHILPNKELIVLVSNYLDTIKQELGYF